MSKNAFWEAYSDPRWQRKRLEIMERHGFQCQRCGSAEKTLNVHHSFYIRDAKPWEYPDYALKCLCKECHEFTHKLSNHLKHLIAKLNMSDLEDIVGYATGKLMVKDALNGKFHVPFTHTDLDSDYDVNLLCGLSGAYGLNSEDVLEAVEAGLPITHDTLARMSIGVLPLDSDV